MAAIAVHAQADLMSLDALRAQGKGQEGNECQQVLIQILVSQAKELLKLEEFQKGDISHALGRAFLRVDELLVQERYMEELKRLAGPKDKRWAGFTFCSQGGDEGGVKGIDCGSLQWHWSGKGLPLAALDAIGCPAKFC